MQDRFPAVSLPVIHSSDVFVFGCGFAGMAAALAVAERGLTAALVEPRTYPGRELFAHGRPFLLAQETAEQVLPEPLGTAVAASRAAERLGVWTLHEDEFKRALEDVLRAAGVKLYYASLPVGLVRAVDGGVAGVILGGKSGRQVVRCSHVLDASETALIARLLDEEFEPPPADSDYRRRLEFTGVSELPEPSVTVKVSDLLTQELAVYPGLGGSDHCHVEYGLNLPRREDSAVDVSRRDQEARLKGLEIVEQLKCDNTAFAEALWASSSHEMQGQFTTRLAGSPPDSAYPSLDLPWGTPIEGSAFAVSAPRVFMLNPAARLPESIQPSWQNPTLACRLGAVISELVQPVSAPPEALPIGEEQRPSTVRFMSQKQPQRGAEYAWQRTPERRIPAAETRDVAVVGGGTAGGISGITAGRLGMNTLLADMNPGLGGTGTYGGIHAYWFGNRTGYSGQVTRMVNDLHDRTRHPRQKGAVPQWNIECKIHALLLGARQAGVGLLLNSMFIGTLVEDQTVRGVVFATRYGPLAVRSRVTIDATGDGDVAAFAGASFVMGSERDHSMMYGYMAQVIRPGKPRNVKTRSVDISNVEDHTRGIMAERRTGQKGDVDHGIYLAPRESRHIQADLTLTLSDQLVRRAFPDVVLLSFSNNDIKGQSTSDWVLMGLQSPHLDIEIPYRALLPAGLENVIVSGKAFSATHDALAAPRMQPDMENLGGIAALAATMAIQRGLTPRELPIRDLQASLVEAGALPQRLLTRNLERLRFSEAEATRKLDRIDTEMPLHRYSYMKNNVRFEGRVDLADLLCMGPEVVPFLTEKHAAATGRESLLMAQMLAVLNSPAGVEELAAACMEGLKGDRLPVQDETIMYTGLPPDQNAASDVAFLIYSLGLARDVRSMPVWQRVIELLALESADDVMDKDRATYYYVTSVCFGIERLGDARCVEMLRRLHSHEAFRRRQSLVAGALEEDYVDERLAYLELLIGRCLARCGSPDGYLVLFDYLRDVRAMHAEHAHTELVRITGNDYGKNPARWADWLERHGEGLPCEPYMEPSDPVQAWREDILIDPAHEEAMRRLEVEGLPA